MKVVFSLIILSFAFSVAVRAGAKENALTLWDKIALANIGTTEGFFESSNRKCAITIFKPGEFLGQKNYWIALQSYQGSDVDQNRDELGNNPIYTAYSFPDATEGGHLAWLLDPSENRFYLKNLGEFSDDSSGLRYAFTFDFDPVTLKITRDRRGCVYSN